jgi:hypothetical protein
MPKKRSDVPKATTGRPTPKNLTPKEVGEIRRKSEAALAQERKAGQGPPWRKDNGRVLYPADELEEYLERITVRPAQPSAS